MTYDELFSLFLKMHPEYFQSAIDWRPQGRCEIKIWISSNEIIYARWHEGTKTFEIRSSKYDIHEEKRCDFCKGKKIINIFGDSIELRNLQREGNTLFSTATIQDEDDGRILDIAFCEFEINYCPICGKKLS